jgi:hypothetical protein
VEYDGKVHPWNAMKTHGYLLAFEKLGSKGWNWSEFLKYMRKVSAHAWEASTADNEIF